MANSYQTGRRTSHRPSILAILIVLITGSAVTALRIYIGCGLPVCLGGQYMADDVLMVGYAESLLKGEWLGEFCGTTLAKSAGYAVYLALLATLNIPYILGNVVFYCVCVFVFCLAVHKLFPNLYVSLALYTYLLYSPIMFNDASRKIYRAGFLSAVTLLLIGSIIGLYGTVVRGQHVIRTMLWSLCASAAFVIFRFTKEDWIWPVSFAVCGLGISAIVLLSGGSKNPSGGHGSENGRFARRTSSTGNPSGISSDGYGAKSRHNTNRRHPRTRRNSSGRSRGSVILCMICLVLPAVSVGAVSFAIRYENNRHYGEFAVNDRNDTYYSKVIGDLYHIDDGEQPPEIWLSRDGLEKAFAVSPTLAETKRYIDGMYEVSWAANADGEMHGDSICRALREAVEANGLYAKGGAVVNEYYKKIHGELKEAFENGSLPKDTKSIYISPGGRGMTREEIQAYFPSRMREILNSMLGYTLNVTSAMPATGDPENIVRMALIVRSPYVLADGTNASAFDTAIEFATADTALYSKAGGAVTMTALIGFALHALLMIVGFFRRDFERVPLMLVSVGMAVSAGMYTFVVLWFCACQTMKPAYENLGGVILSINVLQVLGVSMLVTELARMAGRLRRMGE